jgi:Sec7-like guanine-nucleotide exchange factor
MKSLSVLSKFMGCYNNWKMIKERYQLKWSNENSVDTFKKIINEDNSFNNLLEWLKIVLLKFQNHIEIYSLTVH